MQRIFSEDTLTAAFVDTEVLFGFNANQMLIGAVGGDVEISFDGTSIDGKITVADGLVNFPNVGAGKIWLRGNTFVSRVFAWV